YLMQHGISCELAPAPLLYQNAVGVALAAEHGKSVSAQELLPVYLRPAQAERLRSERESRENK
ncbi:MAG: tRNA (adenosine(37)-N6)-threonylcarbamoyltransferase complex dimerization subunit type 1 TsaB, partial [Eubacteriales bacterium]|nr:tRNA (adenosine(37)-N6)-threonylcarbamoyltransferase complex dimerization subunit type 1 TsaB [Eubacteriales bacterium]